MFGGWDELEQKVLQVIKKNTELQSSNEKLHFDNEVLKEKLEHLELLLLKDSDSLKTLEDEKKAMKNSIELMLSSINSIENA